MYLDQLNQYEEKLYQMNNMPPKLPSLKGYPVQVKQPAVNQPLPINPEMYYSTYRNRFFTTKENGTQYDVYRIYDIVTKSRVYTEVISNKKGWILPVALLDSITAVPNNDTKKEKNMSYDYDCDCELCISQKDPEASKRRYLRDRLETIKYAQKRDLRKVYGLDDDEAPKTPKEMAERLASGRFVVKGAEDKDQKDIQYRWSSYIVWRDPSVKEDKAGFDAAYDELKKALKPVEDAIAIKTPAEALKALEEFEASLPN